MSDIITTADKLACVKRELAMRKATYPQWVIKKRLSAGQAAHQLACMEAIIADYQSQADTEEKKT